MTIDVAPAPAAFPAGSGFDMAALRLVRIPEASEILGVTPREVQRRLRAGARGHQPGLRGRNSAGTGWSPLRSCAGSATASARPKR